MCSRIDIITRLFAHIAAVVLLILIWTSVEPSTRAGKNLPQDIPPAIALPDNAASVAVPAKPKAEADVTASLPELPRISAKPEVTKTPETAETALLAPAAGKVENTASDASAPEKPAEEKTLPPADSPALMPAPAETAEPAPTPAAPEAPAAVEATEDSEAKPEASAPAPDSEPAAAQSAVEPETAVVPAELEKPAASESVTKPETEKPAEQPIVDKQATEAETPAAAKDAELEKTEDRQDAGASSDQGEASGEKALKKAEDVADAAVSSEAEQVEKIAVDKKDDSETAVAPAAGSDAGPVSTSEPDVSAPEKQDGEKGAPAAGDADSPESAPAAGAKETPAVVQPDESGAITIVENDGSENEPDAMPLHDDSGIGVLGDGVYWIGPGADLAAKLPNLPENASLILLAGSAPAPAETLAFPVADVIPAVGSGLNADNAERFLRAVRNQRDRSAVIGVMPDAWGAGFYKGVYLLAVRGLPLDETLAEIKPELDQAGDKAGEITHRLTRLDIADLGAPGKP